MSDTYLAGFCCLVELNLQSLLIVFPGFIRRVWRTSRFPKLSTSLPHMIRTFRVLLRQLTINLQGFFIVLAGVVQAVLESFHQPEVVQRHGHAREVLGGILPRQLAADRQGLRVVLAGLIHPVLESLHGSQVVQGRRQ